MSSKKLFAREATGLVREISLWTAFFATFAEVEIPLGLLTYTSAPFLFPGTNLIIGTLITTIFSIFVSLMYTLITWTTPRTGADYVFTTRVLNPLLGFMSSFNNAFWYIFFLGIYFNWIITVSLSPSLLVIGEITSNNVLIALASKIATPYYVLIIGSVCLIIFIVILFLGTRFVFNITSGLFIISLIGYVLMLALMASVNNTIFISNFNKISSISYSSIINIAHKNGYSIPKEFSPFSLLVSSLGIMPFVYLTTGFAIATSYYAGEVKSIKKSAFYSQVLIAILSGLILILFGVFSVRDFGYDFLGSIWYLSSVVPSLNPFPFPPYLNLFISLLTKSAILLWVLTFFYLIGILAGALPLFMIGSRLIFAWSFDRLLPVKLSEVKGERPIYILILIACLVIIDLILYTLTSFLSFYSGATLGFTLGFMIVCFAAIIFPYRNKDLFEKSSANIKFAKIPLITIAGVVSLAFYGTMAYFLLTNPLYGANTLIVYVAIFVIWLIAALIYITSHYYHKSKGIDLKMIFQEIPPE